MIVHIQEYLESNYSFEPHPLYSKSENMNVFQTHYFGDSIKILDLLYKNSTLFTRLSRKYKIYINVKKYRKQFKTTRNVK
jgi:hypothetical protein